MGHKSCDFVSTDVKCYFVSKTWSVSIDYSTLSIYHFSIFLQNWSRTLVYLFSAYHFFCKDRHQQTNVSSLIPKWILPNSTCSAFVAIQKFQRFEKGGEMRRESWKRDQQMWEYGKKEDFFTKDTSCKGREGVWWALVVEQRGKKNFSRKIHYCVQIGGENWF